MHTCILKRPFLLWFYFLLSWIISFLSSDKKKDNLPYSKIMFPHLKSIYFPYIVSKVWRRNVTGLQPMVYFCNGKLWQERSQKVNSHQNSNSIISLHLSFKIILCCDILNLTIGFWSYPYVDGACIYHSGWSLH